MSPTNIGTLVIGGDVSRGVEEGASVVGGPVWMYVGGAATGVNLRGGFETGVEPNGTVMLALTGRANGVELMVGIETGERV